MDESWGKMDGRQRGGIQQLMMKIGKKPQRFDVVLFEISKIYMKNENSSFVDLIGMTWAE